MPAYGSDTPTLLTYTEAEFRLGLSRRSVRLLVQHGHVRVVKFGRAVRLRADDLDALIEAGGVDTHRLTDTIEVAS
jgi:excisionase family DNA binding protein